MKLRIILVYVFLAIMTIAAMVSLYWLYGPDDVLQINNDHQPRQEHGVPVRPTTQRPDQLVFVIVNYCKLREARGTIRRSLISSTVRIMLPIQTDDGPKTCQQVDAPVLIPKGIEPDTYYLHFEISYQLNPIKTVTESFDSQEFVIE